MTTALRCLDTIRRPRLLIRTARIGVADYRRNVHLHRLLGLAHLPRNEAALEQLITLEQEIDTQRQECAASYSISRHIEVLVAMMGEAQLLRASAPVSLVAAG
ncbi:DUF6477 family protein [Puniceibacterium confluentis]|uniref:DUF6477 family protein n=1 Tax=Puniceibacterium confluentis TaxID=1958944 RepID=UPI0011B5DBAA|nr:DUF6477 family protein [Puniceibacterium confluentis]